MAEPPEPEIRADLHLEIEESLSNISKGGTKALVEYRDIVTTIKFFLDTNEVSLEENVADALYFLEETQKALDNTKGATSTSSVNKSCQVDNIKEACSVPSRSCKEEISRVQLKEPNILFEDFRGMIVKLIIYFHKYNTLLLQEWPTSRKTLTASSGATSSIYPRL